ncbi:IDO2 [Bugula neritina]|uniref:IDO2 n=1 Tax=Bugula neritina TaxID=10212 RepID=A0A7J7KLL4_BUGNE|nr:IDO2 [Bugula neritina]
MRMHEGLDADKFYHELRPYLGGWDKIGMIYEGVSDRPIKMTGGSAAQCTGIQAIDIFLQVQHNSMEHNSRDNEDLVMAYNKCVEAVANLRTNHIQIVAKYILIPKSQKQNGDFQRLDNVGTGGQDLIPFLKKLRNLTRSFLL